MAKPAHPTPLTGRIANNQNISRYILGHHCTGNNKGIISNIMTTDNSSVRPNCRSCSHMCFTILILTAYSTPRVNNISKDTTRAEKHMIPTSNTCRKTYIMLHLAVITENYIGRYHHILSNITPLAYPGPAHNMTEMPNFGTITNNTTLVNNSCRMNKNIVTHKKFSSNLRKISIQ